MSHGFQSLEWMVLDLPVAAATAVAAATTAAAATVAATTTAATAAAVAATEAAATTAATATVSAAEAAATTAAATESAATAGTLFAGTRFVHNQSTAAHVGAVELFDGFASIIFVLHFHETKPTRATGFTIVHNTRGLNLTDLREDVIEFLVCDGVGKVPDVQVEHCCLLSESCPLVICEIEGEPGIFFVDSNASWRCSTIVSLRQVLLVSKLENCSESHREIVPK